MSDKIKSVLHLLLQAVVQTWYLILNHKLTDIVVEDWFKSRTDYSIAQSVLHQIYYCCAQHID